MRIISSFCCPAAAPCSSFLFHRVRTVRLFQPLTLPAAHLFAYLRIAVGYGVRRGSDGRICGVFVGIAHRALLSLSLQTTASASGMLRACGKRACITPHSASISLVNSCALSVSRPRRGGRRIESGKLALARHYRAAMASSHISDGRTMGDWIWAAVLGICKITAFSE